MISFLRGLLINHDTQLTLHLPGRTLFAPEIGALGYQALKRDKPFILFGIRPEGKEGKIAIQGNLQNTPPRRQDIPYIDE